MRSDFRPAWYHEAKRRPPCLSSKIHLEYAEHDAIERLAGLIDVQPEDVAYAALNRLMLQGRNREVQNDIVLTRRWRQDNLPLWSDSAGSVHNYEGMSPDEPVKSKYSV